ncbi:MAG: DMT family transporter [Planctomycetota bacterium]
MPRVPPQLLLLIAIAIWGVSFSAVKVPLDRGVPPFALLTARFWLAVLCLLPWALRGRRDGTLRSEALRGVVTGLFLLLGYVLQTTGMQHATASVGGFLTGLITLLVAVGAVVLFGERLRAPTVLGVALGTAGVAFLCFGGAPPADPDADTSLLGVALLAGSSISYAAHVLVLSRLARGGRETVYCWWQLLTVAVGVSAAMPLWGGVGEVATWGADPQVLGCIAFLGVFALAIAIGIQARAQPRIRQSQVAVLFALQPAFAALGGAVLLGERMTGLEWTGGALIAAGVLCAELLGRGRTAMPAPTEA